MSSNLNDLVGGATTHLPLSKGIDLRTLKAGTQLGLALQISREALQARQTQQVLERRFEQPLMYERCFVFSNHEDALVLWHSVEAVGMPPEQILSRLLSLAGLDALDRS